MMILAVEPPRRRRRNRGGRLRRKIGKLKECRDLLADASQLVVDVARDLDNDDNDERRVLLGKAIAGLELALGAVASRCGQ